MLGILFSESRSSYINNNHLEVVFDLPDTSALFLGHVYVPYNIQSSEELNGKLKSYGIYNLGYISKNIGNPYI